MVADLGGLGRRDERRGVREDGTTIWRFVTPYEILINAYQVQIRTFTNAFSGWDTAVLSILRNDETVQTLMKG